MTKSFADVMSNKENGRRRDSELMCFHPTLANEYGQLGVRLVSAKNREDAAAKAGEGGTLRRIGGDVDSESIAREMAQMVDDNPESFHWVVIEAMDQAEWNALRAKHPPRDKVAADRGRFNAETFRRPALEAAVKDPEPTPEVIDYLLTTLSNGEIERLLHAIWGINEGHRAVVDPKAISAILAGSGTE